MTLTLKHLKQQVFFLAALLVASSAAFSQDDCSVVGQNSFVRAVLDEYYLWYRELPVASPALYDSPEEYLDAVRFRPIDKSFSYIASAQATTAFYSNSQFIGIGFGSRLLSPEEYRIAQVFPNSPASDAGLARGDYLLAVNGRLVPELIASGELNAELGPSEIGYTVELTWRSLKGRESSAVVKKRPVTIPTVSQTAIFNMNGLPVGYVHFRNFVEPSIAALNATFAELRREGVVDLILDLRYNGGGLVSVAQHLASLIGGMRTSARIFVDYMHNDKQTARNRQVRFDNPPEAISAPRVVIITSRSSASSSELVINGLNPLIPVTLVGRRTFGKPVGQYGFEFCEKIFFPVSFHSVNSVGEGEYYDGFPVDCSVRDGLNKPLADPEEASLAEALYYLRNDACSPDAAQRLETTDRGRLVEHTGFGQIINAR
jgi:C-terminal processing protease CtpA/Prc